MCLWYNVPMARTKNRRRVRLKLSRRGKIQLIVLGLIILAIIGISSYYAATHHERVQVADYEHNARFDNYVKVLGIDVSYVQKDIDWNKVKNSGIDFAFIRAGFRDTDQGKLYTDEYFDKNMKHAKRAGLMVGVYFFSQATSKSEAIAEAEYVIDLVDRYELTLPIVFDYEEYGDGRLAQAISSGELTPDKIFNICRAFTSRVEAAGYESCVYGNYNMLTNTSDGAYLSKFTNIWVAQYNYRAEFAGNYRFWQCTDSQVVPGIEGYVDLDFMYLDPNGVWETTSSNTRERTSITECKIKIKGNKHRYWGHAVEPKVKVSKGLFGPKKGRDYTVSYIHNTSAGTGYAVITGIGKYKDTVIEPFEIK